MSNLKTAYLPIDRALALAQGATLPEQTDGTALFADISGFTPLTEALRTALGERRGAEELTRHLNVVYEALVAEVTRFGGSVIVFSGDAITCWFDNRLPTFSPSETGLSTPPSSPPSEKDLGTPASSPSPPLERGPGGEVRAVAAALAMQAAMSQFGAVPLPDGTTITLAIKIAIASGSARRFVVGDPAIQLIDVLAGATITRMANAESLANRGEILVDTATAQASDTFVLRDDWRTDPASNERFAVLTGLAGAVEAAPWPDLPELPDEITRPWLLPAINAQLDTGQGEFLTELRPAVALFLRFSGLDYDAEGQSSQQLDEFIRRVQAICGSYDGVLVQLTVGDKGSYLYAAFGAPTAHEDDAERAVNAAVALQALSKEFDFLEPLQIGISRGTIRVGAYGSTTRRVYGVLGDEVNLAARLMQHAAPGQVLISERIQQSLGANFELQALPALQVKGKRDPVAIFALVSAEHQPTLHFQEPVYALPMIGRQADLALIEVKLAVMTLRKGQVIGISAEAGMGKSRLVAEVIRLARRRELTIYGGECQSYGTNSSYLVWQPIWRSFFNVHPAATLAEQMTAIEATLNRYAPQRLNALPLLGTVLNLSLPETDFTQGLDPAVRKSALETLLLDCLKAVANEAASHGSGLLFILEDLHWIDPASRDLLAQVARVAADLPIGIVLAYRPPQRLTQLEDLAYFTGVALAEFSPAESEQLIRAKLSQWTGDDSPISPTLIETITQRSQGNPFYVEELLNYMQDRDVALHDPAALAALDLPDSLQSLILTRIDQLTERQKTTLRVASVIGRLFRFHWLHGYYPGLGEREGLREDLDALSRLEITPLDTPEPELAYLFKHIITQEVAYESIGYATRAVLHEQFADYLEQVAEQDTERFLDLLAYHYERSDNLPKKRHYLRRAGEAAARRYDNTSAVDYLSRALAVADPDDLEERFIILRSREKIHSIAVDYALEKADLDELEAVVEQLNDNTKRAIVGIRRSFYERVSGNYEASLEVAQRAAEFAKSANAIEEELTAYVMVAIALNFLARYEAGLEIALDSLRLAGLHQRQRVEGMAASTVGLLLRQMGRYPEALAYQLQGHALKEKVNDKVNMAIALSDAADTAYHMGNSDLALTYGEQSLALAQEAGDPRSIATCLRILASLAMEQRDFARARVYLDQAIMLAHQMGSPSSVASNLEHLSALYFEQGDLLNAIEHKKEALNYYLKMRENFSVAVSYNGLGLMYSQLNDLDTARPFLQEALVQAAEIRSALLNLVIIAEGIFGLTLALGRPQRAAELAGLVLSHPATPGEVIGDMRRKLPALETALGADELAAALERGKMLDVDTILNDMRAELETT